MKKLLCLLLLVSCRGGSVTRTGPCDSDDAGLQLPAGFCARVFADTVGVARHLVVAPNGDVYIALENARESSAGTTKLTRSKAGIAVLRDTTGDGRADVRAIVEDSEGGSGMALLGDTLFFSTPTTVYRFTIDRAQFGRLRDRQIVAGPLPPGGHSSRSLALGDSTALFVNIGSVGNMCDNQDPCGQLSERAGIWRFDARRTNQAQSDGVRYATGIRNAVGLTWHDGALYATQHGREGLSGFRQYYGRNDEEELPAEEFMRVQPGDDFGWPYCYFDHRRNQLMLAPEYGGNGSAIGRCNSMKNPLIGFPGHWAPDGLLFYDGKQFPERYRGGAFIAFHGSWVRREAQGFNVVFVPFNGSVPGKWEVFADGFAGRRKSNSAAAHRPVGLAVGPDGSLYVSDDQRGRIYVISWRGQP